MANRLHIVINNKQEKSSLDKMSEPNVALQDYISELLIEPIKDKTTALLKSIEKKNSIQKNVVISNDRSLQSSSKLLDEGMLTINDELNIEFSNHNVLTKENIESKKKQVNQFSEPDPRLERVSKLLEKITTLPLPKSGIETQIKTENFVKNEVEIELKQEQNVKNRLKEEQDKNELIQTTSESSFIQREKGSLRDALDESFQTLIFDVNNLPLAVPLIKLGGIVNITNQDITPLVGTPDWFLGLVPNERGNLMVVDTQKFIMPERPVVDNRTYDYLIVLDNSQWALACHSVGDAKNMHASDIRWSNKSSKRPWFAGMVVEYMSALIEVDALINQLAEQIVD